MTTRIRLRGPEPVDEEEFLASVRRSRTLHHPWVTPPRSPEAFRAYLTRLAQPENRGFLACRHDTGAIGGVVEITNIVLGRFRSGYLGYYAFAGHEHRGLMREALGLVLREAFDVLKLHRIEANIQPGNARSIALAKSCGFSKEGFSPRFLKVGGRWRDHERWAILADGP